MYKDMSLEYVHFIWKTKRMELHSSSHSDEYMILTVFVHCFSARLAIYM